ncbi:hypothetical protein C1I95_32315 [Micromonospora craterilacus]|uniref:Uncharacterized protein n=1 Tax=Micromonospora craterilacus TaxID=1655439 RepID=A0A2W2D2K6_9ACTN|nr:hypothetical protein [Micromonospora craterilacus]PZG06086.1 hypothetical protein C1I95_32315 [Micromonospora craterilacus]
MPIMFYVALFVFAVAVLCALAAALADDKRPPATTAAILFVVGVLFSVIAKHPPPGRQAALRPDVEEASGSAGGAE